MESLLIITGTMGSGKTSVLGEASDILRQKNIIHAAIDLDALGLAHLASVTGNATMYRNLRSVCENYSSLGVKRLLLARAMEDCTELDLCRRIVSATSTVICRITASIKVMEHRVKIRESGVSQREYVGRVAKLNAILDRTQLEDFSVCNENRPLTEVVQEILFKVGWI
jgi:hypothetical protein